MAELPRELHGTSVFLADGNRVFHTYSTIARGTEQVGGTHDYLDMTALGGQEDWEEPKGRVQARRRKRAPLGIARDQGSCSGMPERVQTTSCIERPCSAGPR